MAKCCTIGCPHTAGNRVIQWDDYPDYADEPVCDSCADFYTALGSLDFTIQEVS